MPALVRLSHPSKRQRESARSAVRPASSKRDCCQCVRGHEWQAVVATRRKNRCGECRKINWCKPDRIRSTARNLSGQRAHEMSPPTPNVFAVTVLGDLLGRLDPTSFGGVSSLSTSVSGS